jgi:2-polyprenyl-6-methoxyphenol hydroxylase-like FAD-dependent oxidoreductase
MTDILVVGAGPVGLTMAAELARHGARCRVIEKLAEPSPYCRAIGVTPRTLEVWEDLGVARPMIDAGLWIEGLRSVIQGQPARDVRTDFPGLPFNSLGLPQNETERILGEHMGRFGLVVERGVTLTGLRETADGVVAVLTRPDGAAEQAQFRYVVGCDGAHSVVRHAAGIAFEGEALPVSFMLGDVHVAWDLPRGFTYRALRLTDRGAPDMFVAIPLPEPGRYRVTMLATEKFASPAGPDHGLQTETRGPELADIQAIADALIPQKPVLSDLRWSSTFRISMRLAEHYRKSRLFIAGDAAHIHPPTGGQGMNTGVQDAYNLAWKLALVTQGLAPETLLDSYEAERRPVGADVVARTRAAAMNFGREAGGAPDRLADMQISISYRGTRWVRQEDDERGENAPGAGDRAPDASGLVRRGVGFPLRFFDALRGTEHVLAIKLDGAERLADSASLSRELHARFNGRVRTVAITATDVGDAPGIAVLHDRDGAFAAAYGSAETAFLIRPDGHIAWRGSSFRDAGLMAHLGAILL